MKAAAAKYLQQKKYLLQKLQVSMGVVVASKPPVNDINYLFKCVSQ